MHLVRMQVGPEEDKRLMHATVHEEGDNSTCLSCYGANSSPEQCCNTCEEVSSPCKENMQADIAMAASGAPCWHEPSQRLLRVLVQHRMPRSRRSFCPCYRVSRTLSSMR